MAENTQDPESPQSSAIVELGITRIDLKAVPRALSEVLAEIAPSGDKVKVADITDMQIVVHSVRPFNGQFGPAAYVIFTDENGVLYNTVVGQKIVLAKLLAAMPYLPISMTITRKDGGAFGRYYDAE